MDIKFSELQAHLEKIMLTTPVRNRWFPFNENKSNWLEIADFTIYHDGSSIIEVSLTKKGIAINDNAIIDIEQFIFNHLIHAGYHISGVSFQESKEVIKGTTSYRSLALYFRGIRNE